MFDQIPVEIPERYEGRWIVWDQYHQQVVGTGVTLDEAENQAEQSKTDGLLRVHHVLQRGIEIAGLF